MLHVRALNEQKSHGSPFRQAARQMVCPVWIISNPTLNSIIGLHANVGGEAMIPEALHKGGSTIVLPAVGGFLVALYLALLETAFM